MKIRQNDIGAANIAAYDGAPGVQSIDRRYESQQPNQADSYRLAGAAKDRARMAPSKLYSDQADSIVKGSVLLPERIITSRTVRTIVSRRTLCAAASTDRICTSCGATRGCCTHTARRTR